MIRVGILGATGYTALELIQLLLRHPEVEITTLTSRQGDLHVSETHPRLTGRLDLRLRELSPAEAAANCDCVFSCLPHAASASSVKAFMSCIRPER